MGRKAKKHADNLATAALFIGLAALGIGIYIEYKLRPYRIFHAFTSEQRGWRDQAFEIAIYACCAAVVLFLLAKLVRRI